MLKAWMTVAAAALVLIAGASADAAEPSVTCPGGQILVAGFCVATVNLPGRDPANQVNVPPLAAPKPRQCSFGGHEIPCTHERLGRWSAEHGCYITPTKLQPTPGHPVWNSRTDGIIYDCVHPLNTGLVRWVWGPADAATVVPAELAQ